MRKMMTIRMAAAGALAVAGVAAAPTSSAQAVYTDCLYGTGHQVCMWSDASALGFFFDLRTQDANLHDNPCYNCVSSKHPNSNGTWGDQVSTIRNDSDIAYCFYRDANFGGGVLVRLQPHRDGDLSWAMNDEISSVKPC